MRVKLTTQATTANILSLKTPGFKMDGAHLQNGTKLVDGGGSLPTFNTCRYQHLLKGCGGDRVSFQLRCGNY